MLELFKHNKSLAIIALVAIVNALGYGIIIPILYTYSKHFGLSDFDNGLLFALFSLCQFASTPIIGRLSDKYGRKPLLILSIAGTAASFIMMAFAPNTLFLFLARALDGITAGNIPVALAVISDTTEQKDRARGFGIISASFGFGFVFGPAISAFTVGYSSILPFLIAAAVSIVAVIITALFLPETNKHIGQVHSGKVFDFKKMAQALLDPNVGVTFIITLVYFFAFACAIIYGFQPFTKNVLHLDASQTALLFTLFGIVGFLSQIFLVYRFSKYFGLKKAFSFGLVSTGIAFLIMFLSQNVIVFILGAVLMGVVNGISQTLIPTILSQETDAKSQGSIMGLNASYQSIGMIFGPIAGGLLATVLVSLPFLVGAILMFVCFGLSFLVMRKGVKKEAAF